MRRAPALHTHARIEGLRGTRILKVLEQGEAALGTYRMENILFWQAAPGLASADSLSTACGQANRVRVSEFRDPDVIRPGDVVRLSEGSSLVSVLIRRGSRANSLFITERCNSLCVMCSQPPRDEDDAWRIGELSQTLALIDKDERQLGFTGGEPTLLGADLANLLSEARETLPDTHLHVLTNGRAFAKAELAKALGDAGGRQTTWAVPLYGDVASLHDDVVGAPGALTETLEGLYELARRDARVEIRVVLHAMTAPRLRELSAYIYRRMPFVEHVAFMGLEPMGFAKSNRERLWIDPVDYGERLSDAVHHLALRGMAVSVYNLPYCVLPRDLWPFARQSISDWKNMEDEICAGCSMRASCSGFFRSAGAAWRSRAIAAIPLEELDHELA